MTVYVKCDKRQPNKPRIKVQQQQTMEMNNNKYSIRTPAYSAQFCVELIFFCIFTQRSIFLSLFFYLFSALLFVVAIHAFFFWCVALDPTNWTSQLFQNKIEITFINSTFSLCCEWFCRFIWYWIEIEENFEYFQNEDFTTDISSAQSEKCQWKESKITAKW